MFRNFLGYLRQTKPLIAESWVTPVLLW